jgi:hypothetical protein
MVSSKQNVQLFVKHLKDTLFPAKIFVRVSNVTFKEKFSYGRQVVPCGRTDMTKLSLFVFQKRLRKCRASGHNLHRPVMHTLKFVVLFSLRLKCIGRYT